GRILVVDAPGKAWAWCSTRLDSYDDQPVGQVVAGVSRSVAGIVVGEDGRPIEGATVGLSVEVPMRSDSLAFSRHNGRAVTTDRMGRFLIPRVPADARAYASAEASGYVTYSDFRDSAAQGGPIVAGAQDVRIVLKRGAREKLASAPDRVLHGQVVRGSKPTGQTVLRMGRATDWPETIIELPLDGRFTAVVGVGEYNLRLHDSVTGILYIDGKGHKTFQVKEGSPKTPIEMEVRTDKETRCRLVDSQGRGVAGVVTDGWRRIETDPDGSFVCHRQFAGQVITAWDHQRKLAKAFVPGEQLPACDILLELPAAIHGRLELPTGRKLEEVSFTLWQKTGPESGSGLSKGFWQCHIDPSGEFRIAPIPVGLDVTVSFIFKGGNHRRDYLSLKAGESRNIGVYEVFAKETRDRDAVVTGRVVDEHDQPIKGLRVYAISDSSGNVEADTITDLQGRFELKGLARGAVTIDASYPGYGHHCKLEVQAPAADVKFQVSPPGWQWYGKELPEVIVGHWINGPPAPAGELQHNKGKLVLLAIGTDTRVQRVRERVLELHEKYRDKGLVVIVINSYVALEGDLDGDDSNTFVPKISLEEACKGLDRKTGLIVGIDAHASRLPMPFVGSGGATQLLYGFQGYSGDGAMFLIDKKGKLRTAVTVRNVHQKIEAMLQE
ncbi:MAG: carboxypeptidase-like regulatory domain-containing protein, partial [Phycisphaerales bacterium]|nr:carboxypeptidase-like regulatory domain-containing protein [Phycisphaerales bacterium]